MKKLLLLGGLRYLIPVIKKAKALGYYVITCDYLPDNIAHQYSDEYCNVSIIDKEAVLKVARELQIDGIMSFAVDPGVVTAAYVAEQMGLPMPGPYESIKILQDKGLFRAFLKQHNFNTPKSAAFSDISSALETINADDLPVIVKPTDAAGSKGVTKVTALHQLESAIETAVKASPTKNVIIEQFLDKKGHSSDTDSFALNGKFQFISINCQRFDTHAPNPYTPSAYSWPSNISEENQQVLKEELQRLITLLKMNSGVYNIEVRETTNGTPYIMECAPRGGGNRLSEMLEYATGTDLITAAIQAALGESIPPITGPDYKGQWAEVILYSNQAGKFVELNIDKELQNKVIELDLWVKKGERINAFKGANDAIGTLVLKFDTQKELEAVLEDYANFVSVIIN